MRKLIERLAQNSGQEQETEEKERKFVLTLRFSTLVPLICIGLAAISLAYIGGVMSGRNSSRESADLPAGTHIIPADQQPQDENEDPGGRKVLLPGDLTFAQELRGVPPLRLPAEPKQPEAVQPASPAQPAKPAPPSSETAAEASEPAPLTQNDIYDYVLQMGAFRDETGADNLRQRLEGHSLRTQLERSGRMFIVLVRLRGNENRAAEIARLAGELKLGEPVIRERKKVSP